MIEALRGLGYSTGTAIADIIDNSISAGASHVDLAFVWNGDRSHVAILDDGTGMDERELEAAMRLGDRNPLDPRQPNDLGRFGLGLKTASFSQCRRLTVASMKGGLNCFRWDLDVLAASKDDGWHLLEGPAPGSEPLLDPLLATGRGTLVLWECLDNILAPGFRTQDFLDLIDVVERHIAMVFHRFIEESDPGFQIRISGRAINPWDPFLSAHPATAVLPVCRRQGVEVQCYVLPHKDRLSKDEEESAAGPDGWTAQQGFYVYRNRRLLVAGNWLGLGRGRAWTKEEAHRLARIRLDISNTADADWKIDIRKSKAQPPVAVRPLLTRLAEDTRARARRVFAYRGQPVSSKGTQPFLDAWRSDHTSGGIRYRLDHSHPAIRSVLDEAGSLAPQVLAMLRVIEETVPVQRIWLDTTEAAETPRTGFAGEPDKEVLSVLSVLYRNLVKRKKFSPAVAREQLLHTDPFHRYPDLVASLPEDPDAGDQDVDHA